MTNFLKLIFIKNDLKKNHLITKDYVVFVAPNSFYLAGLRAYDRKVFGNITVADSRFRL